MSELVVGVLGASGGVGATSLAAALSVVSATRGWVTSCVDARSWGGGLDVTFGAENAPGLRWPDLAHVEGAVDGEALLGRLPQVAGVAVLSAGRPYAATPVVAAAAVADAVLSAAQVCVVDLDPPAWEPGAAGSVPGAAAAQGRVGGAVDGVDGVDGTGLAWWPLLTDVVLLVAGHAAGLAAAQAVTDRVVEAVPRTWMCDRRAPGGRELGPFVAQRLDLPHLGSAGHDRRLAEALRCGEPPGSTGPVAQLSRTVLDQLLSQAGAS